MDKIIYLYNRIKGLIYSLILKPFKTDYTNLLVVDCIYPYKISQFRYVEFSKYIDKYNALVYSTGSSLIYLNEKRDISFFIEESEYSKNIKKFNICQPIKAKLGVCVFLNNANFFLNFFELNKIPFIFTLYPGGGFIMDHEESDIRLKRVFSSPYFRKVIVTQNVTYNYLNNNKFCRNDKIHLIYGCPLNISNRFINPKKNSNTIVNVCFVAAKYMDKGFDKGYDVFIEVIREILKTSDNFRFHVVGGFSEEDIDIEDIKSYLSFYGFMEIESLRDFYLDQHIIVSPNRANTLHKGAFDGFPTASVIEAGLCEVAMLVTDELNQNIAFENNKDYILINHSIKDISDIIIGLDRDRSRLMQLQKRGRLKLEYLFSEEYQMVARFNIINELIK